MKTGENMDLQSHFMIEIPKKMALESGFTSTKEARRISDRYEHDAEIRKLIDSAEALSVNQMLKMMNKSIERLDTLNVDSPAK